MEEGLQTWCAARGERLLEREEGLNSSRRGRRNCLGCRSTRLELDGSLDKEILSNMLSLTLFLTRVVHRGRIKAVVATKMEGVRREKKKGRKMGG